jgi:hypothetical protein
MEEGDVPVDQIKIVRAILMPPTWFNIIVVVEGRHFWSKIVMWFVPLRQNYRHDTYQRVTVDSLFAGIKHITKIAFTRRTPSVVQSSPQLAQGISSVSLTYPNRSLNHPSIPLLSLDPSISLGLFKTQNMYSEMATVYGS